MLHGKRYKGGAFEEYERQDVAFKSECSQSILIIILVYTMQRGNYGGYNNQFTQYPYMNPPVVIVNPMVPPGSNLYSTASYQQPQQQQPINSVDGILIEEEYVPEKGDPVVI